MGVEMLDCRKLKLLLTALIIALAVFWKPAPLEAEHASFKSEIYPILKTYCVECHQPGSAGYEHSGLDMSTYETLMKGTSYGAVVTPGDAFTSNLMVLIEGRIRKNLMPPHNSFQRGPSVKGRRTIRTWIVGGAGNNQAFRTGVQPLLRKHCLECHKPGGKGYGRSGLDMRTYISLMKGTDFGPVVIPGDAFTSNLMVLIAGRASSRLKMPHSELRKLSRREKYLIRAWINRGARNN